MTAYVASDEPPVPRDRGVADVVVASAPAQVDADPELAELEARLPAWTRELLACLTPRQRQAFALREVLGLTCDEVGERLDVSVSRASQLHQAAVGVITEAAQRGALLTLHVPVVVAHVRPPGRGEDCVVPEEMRKALDLPVEVLNIGVRAANCLERAGIAVVGDLVLKSESEILKIHNMGRKTLTEIRDALGAIGLHLGMAVAAATPPTSSADD